MEAPPKPPRRAGEKPFPLQSASQPNKQPASQEWSAQSRMVYFSELASDARSLQALGFRGSASCGCGGNLLMAPLEAKSAIPWSVCQRESGCASPRNGHECRTPARGAVGDTLSAHFVPGAATASERARKRDSQIALSHSLSANQQGGNRSRLTLLKSRKVDGEEQQRDPCHFCLMWGPPGLPLSTDK